MRPFIWNVRDRQVHRESTEPRSPGTRGREEGASGLQVLDSLGLETHGSWALLRAEPLCTDTQTAHSDFAARESTSQSSISTGRQVGNRRTTRQFHQDNVAHTRRDVARPGHAYLGEVSSGVSPCRRGHRWLPVDVPGRERSGLDPATSVQGSQALGRLSTSEHSGQSSTLTPQTLLHHGCRHGSSAQNRGGVGRDPQSRQHAWPPGSSGPASGKTGASPWGPTHWREANSGCTSTRVPRALA